MGKRKFKRAQNYQRKRFEFIFFKNNEFNGNFQDGGRVVDFSLPSPLNVSAAFLAENKVENRLEFHQLR